MTERTTRSIEIEKTVDASPEEVWEALTTEEGLRSWFPLDAKVRTGDGGTVWLSWGPGCEGEAPIHVFEPGNRFGWTEHYGDDDQGRPIQVAVDFHIEGREGSTVVRLVQSGLSADAEWDEMYDALVDGWTYFMFNLQHWLGRHRGRTRSMVWARVPTAGDRAATWQALAAAGLVPEAAAGGAAAGAKGPGVVRLGGERTTRVVSTRPGHHFAAVLPELEDSVFFVELEGRHVGLWLSTYALDERDVSALQSALDQGVEEALGAELGG